jgi:hypothetical protein
MVKPIVQLTPTLIHVEGKPLGRHRLVNWHQVAKLAHEDATPIDSVSHASNLTTCLDQRSLVSCTGNATAHALSSQPFTFELDESQAVDIYSRATQDDNFPGVYPPNDTGSSGFFAMQAAQELGYIKGFAMCVGLTAVLQQLQTRPGISGMDWYQGFDTPDDNGVVVPSGLIRGGHEVCEAALELVYLASGAIDIDNSYIVFQNSWGKKYGVKVGNRDGCFRMSLANYALILQSGGDATFPEAP